MSEQENIQEEDFNDLIEDSKNFSKQISENSNYFEKKITYIGAGSIVLLITFVTNLKDALTIPWTFVTGEFFLVAALLMNLFSYILTNYFSNKCLDKIDSQCENKIRNYSNTTNILSKKLNKKVDVYNFINFLLLMIGLIFTMIFVANNI